MDAFILGKARTDFVTHLLIKGVYYEKSMKLRCAKQSRRCLVMLLAQHAEMGFLPDWNEVALA